MSLKDISWGGVILGAAAVTAIIAFAPIATLAAGGAGSILAAAGEMGMSQGAVLGIGAIAGGALGNMISNACGRVQDAATTLIRR